MIMLSMSFIGYSGWIRTATMLDREAEPFYWLTVFAHDQGTVPLSSSVEVYIEVGDVNDNAPEPDSPVYYATVKENSPADVPVLTISVRLLSPLILKFPLLSNY